MHWSFGRWVEKRAELYRQISMNTFHLAYLQVKSREPVTLSRRTTGQYPPLSSSLSSSPFLSCPLTPLLPLLYHPYNFYPYLSLPSPFLLKYSLHNSLLFALLPFPTLSSISFSFSSPSLCIPSLPLPPNPSPWPFHFFFPLPSLSSLPSPALPLLLSPPGVGLKQWQHNGASLRGGKLAGKIVSQYLPMVVPGAGGAEAAVRGMVVGRGGRRRFV